MTTGFALLAMSGTGIVMGLLTSLVGLPPSVEPLVWIGFYAMWGVAVIRLELPPFLTPLLASLLSGVWVSLVQFALWERYVASNPWYAAEIAEAGEIGLPALMGFALAMGLFWGLLVGSVCWAVARRRAA